MTRLVPSQKCECEYHKENHLTLEVLCGRLECRNTRKCCNLAITKQGSIDVSANAACWTKDSSECIYILQAQSDPKLNGIEAYTSVYNVSKTSIFLIHLDLIYVYRSTEDGL